MPPERASLRVFLAIAGAIVGLQVFVLLEMGQPALCACGTVKLWHGVVASRENSQQVSDWYSFSHVIHGIGFYGILRLIASGLLLGPRFALAVAAEAGWEIFENTPFLIDRYRQSALAQGYVGDSVINSLSDTLAMASGFFLTRRLPAWSSVALVVALELFVGVMIRDNLTLNVIQLVSPNAALSRWQAAE